MLSKIVVRSEIFQDLHNMYLRIPSMFLCI